ncbi:MAG: hypothetical protein IPG59_05510 [Candidatus Melainabacteria bacterium]|nr:MAG: hypothetical protein IPG59_05510 [Candidatus Melainabacteria bacterium]
MTSFKFHLRYFVVVTLCLALFKGIEGTRFLISAMRWDDQHIYNVSIIAYLMMVHPLLNLFLVNSSGKKNWINYFSIFSQTFPKLRKVFFIQLLAINSVITIVAIDLTPKAVNCCNRFVVYAADGMGAYEFAEDVFKKGHKPHDNCDCSYVTASRRSELDMNGLKADDPRFDALITKFYGPQSLQMGDRKLCLAHYYVTQHKNQEKAVIALKDALAIYKPYPLSTSYVYAKKALACSKFELGKKGEARKDLAEVESLIAQNPTTNYTFYSYSAQMLAEKIGDADLASKFKKWDQKYLASIQKDGFWYQNLWNYMCVAFLYLGVEVIAAVNLITADCLMKKKSAIWKEQLRNTTNPSELFSLLNNLIIVATYRKKWDFVHLYTEMSSRLNNKLL